MLMFTSKMFQIKMDMKFKCNMVCNSIAEGRACLVCTFQANGNICYFGSYCQPVFYVFNKTPRSLHWNVWNVYDQLAFLWGGSYNEYKAVQTLEKGVSGKGLFQRCHNWSVMTWKLPFTKSLSGQSVHNKTPQPFLSLFPFQNCISYFTYRHMHRVPIHNL